MSTSAARTIVTIYEEYGAGAGVVGRLVADALGVDYVGKAVSSESIEEAAERADEEENFFERFLRSFTPMPTADADIAWALEARSDAEVAEQNVASLRELVANGAVVHGRSGASVLADEPHALHVKLVAPKETRIANAALESGITPELARKRQEREDRVRADMAKRIYRWDPARPDNFDLIVNTGVFTPEQAAAVIVNAFRVRHPDAS